MCHSSIECRVILYNLRLGLNSFHEKRNYLRENKYFFHEEKYFFS